MAFEGLSEKLSAAFKKLRGKGRLSEADVKEAMREIRLALLVADSRYPRDGRFIEEIGTYNPLTTPAELKVDAERAQAWIKTGAQPTDTVRSLLKKAGAL